VSINLPLLILLLIFRIPNRITSTFSVATNPVVLDIPEQVIIVSSRSVVTLLVDIVEISGKGELLFNDLDTFRVVKVVIIQLHFEG
jgi:hypothetical protein